MAKVLEVDGLSKSFGDRKAVDGVSFSIAEGETYGLLGPNGAGKTTTISMTVGILDRDTGRVRIDDRPHDAYSMTTKALLGYVPQELALYDDLSALENVRFFAGLHGMRGKESLRRSEEVLDLVGLADRAKDSLSTYSGGMARRASIAVALLNRPRVLVLDEPTAGLDPQSRASVLEVIRELVDQGSVVLFTTHLMAEAERLCDRVGIIDDGHLVVEGTKRELVTAIGAGDRVRVVTEGPAAELARAMSALACVREVSETDSVIEAVVDDAETAMSEILSTAFATGVVPRSVTVQEPDLDSVFLHYTGRALRD